MSEDLKPAGGNLSLERPVIGEAILQEPMHIYDPRSGTYRGLTYHIDFMLDPWEPSLFACCAKKHPVSQLEKDSSD